VSLLEDLKRRDFTINAMAMELVRDKIIDPFGGLKDLEAGIIRVLHPNSFVDDPTRVFRALRFAGRFGFKLEPKTDQLAKEVIKGGLLEKLSPERISHEIISVLNEPERETIIGLLFQFGILEILSLKLPESVLFKNIKSNLKACSSLQCEGWFVYLLGILDLQNPSPFLSFTSKELNKIKKASIILKNLSKLKSAQKPSEAYNLLEGSSDEELLFVMSCAPQIKSKLVNFMQVYRKVRLQIGGEDLKRLGIKEGPLYGELLSSALNAKLDGKLKTKKGEIEYVKKLHKNLLTV